MSSSEQYVFSSNEGQAQHQPDLLPDEFRWTPRTAGGATVSADIKGGNAVITRVGDTTNGGIGTYNDTSGVTYTDTRGGTGVYTDSTAGQYVGNTGIVPNNSGIVDSSGQYVTDQSGQYVPSTGYDAAPMPSAEQIYQQTQQNIPPDVIAANQGWQPTDANAPYANGGQQVPTDQAAPLPQGQDSSGSSADSGHGGGGYSWVLDRGLALGATGIAAQKYIPNLSSFMPEGASIPSLTSMRSIPKGEWTNALKTDLGKAMGGAWVADTLLDATMLKDRDTSWKTMAVDIATPFAVNHFLPGFGLGKTVAMTVGAHAVEKLLFEDKKEK